MRVETKVTYQRHRAIGSGKAMNSTVYLVTDDQLGGQFAAKEIAKSEFVNSISTYFDEATAVFAAKHPNVIPIQYAGESPDTVHLVMEYMPDGSLLDRIRLHPLRASLGIQMAVDVLHGLARVHQKNFVHLDVKPANVLYKNTSALVADFGQARRCGQNGIVSRLPPLYPPGIPPECFVHGRALRESDIYQVGVTLYRALNGDPLFRRSFPPNVEALKDSVVAGTFPDRKLWMPHVPTALRNVVLKAMDPDPSKRFQNVLQFADALVKLAPRDWECSRNQHSRAWTLQRHGKATLVVERRPSSKSGRFDVEVFTDLNGSRRAKGRRDLWANALTRVQCDKHMRRVFRELRNA